MFILRLAIEAFHFAEAELFDESHPKKEEKSLNSPTYPPPAPPHSVDPIIFQFGRKRSCGKDLNEARRQLFSPKRLCFDSCPESESSTLLYDVFEGYEESLTVSKHRNRLSSYPDNNKRPKLNHSRVPFKGGTPNATQEGLPLATLTHQWLMTAFWGQLLAARMWTPPKEEPLDLSCKQPKPKFANKYIFSSIRRLVEPMEAVTDGDDAEIRRCNSFPQTCRPSVEMLPGNSFPETPPYLIPKFETLVNSMRLFNDLRSNYLNSADEKWELKSLPRNDSDDLQCPLRSLKVMELI